MSKLPLVDRDDLDKAGDWFHRHGRSSVFFGRLVPGIRSLISLPAGAQRMNLAAFSLCTIAGSGIWNTGLIALGATLGANYELVDRYANYLDLAVYAGFGAMVITFVVRKIRRSSQRRTGD
jgi:membrane protein DedA with SNARE-associated domain